MNDALWACADVVGDSMLSPALSALLVYGVLLGGFALLALLAAWRQHVAHAQWLAAQAHETAVSAGPLRAGETLLRGRWEPETPGESPPVRVRITQRGIEAKGKSGWSTSWGETQRVVEARPFVLRDLRGTLVRVEPGGAPLLADKLDRVERVARDQRHRHAQLTADEDVYIVGRLELPAAGATSSAYRGAAPTPVMRAPAGRRMLISTAPLHDRAAKREGYHRRAVGAAVAGAVFFVGVIMASYNARVVFGRDAMAEVVGRRTWVTHGKKGDTDHFAVSVRTEQDAPFEEQIARADFDACCAEGDRVPVRRVPITSWSELGAGARAWGVTLSVGLFALVMAWLVYFGARPREWYERRRVVDYASGRL